MKHQTFLKHWTITAIFMQEPELSLLGHMWQRECASKDIVHYEHKGEPMRGVYCVQECHDRDRGQKKEKKRKEETNIKLDDTK